MKFIRIPASKVLFLLYVLMFLFVPDFALHEGKGFEIERPKPEDWKPENEAEAEKQLEEARKEEERIKEKSEKLKEEEEKAKKRVEEYREIEGTVGGFKEFQESYAEALKDYNEKLQAREAIDKVLGEWENLRKNIEEELKKFQAELTEDFEPSYQEPMEEPSWWSKTVTKVKAWIAERRIEFNEFLGDKQKVIQLRQDLADLHAQLGTESSLLKVRDLTAANELDKLGLKISKNLEELNRSIAKHRGAEDIHKEIKNLVAGLALLSVELDALKKTEGIDEGEAERIGKEIQESVKKALDDLGISGEEQKKLMREIQESVEKRSIER